MPITIKQIHSQVCTSKKVSRRQLFRYFKRLRIKPVGIRTHPRLYPDNTADRIIDELGLPTMAQLQDLQRRSLAATSRIQKRRAA